ncbi:MAG TPA: methyltransferase domain-containing protein [Dehalococcoidia bacterium]|nr:methyltransferase domain-containing protein [Dehalococcoidia bacterium]
MSEPVEYDDFADIYDAWVATAPVTERNLPFYVDEYIHAPGVVVELGVGNGRIAIVAARRGKTVIGIDSSAAMLDVCKRRAEAAGIAARISLVQADFRDFKLRDAASLISIPFHSIGHLTTRDDRLEALRSISGQLTPGGRLIFDTFVFDPEMARTQHGAPRLRAEYRDELSGHDVLIWATTFYDFVRHAIRIIAYTDELDATGLVLERRYRRLSFSWSDPAEIRGLLAETGFEIEALFGDYDRRPFDDGSQEQVWVARRPI